MSDNLLKDRTWNFLSLLVILAFGILQIARWVVLPQFMDIYYHLLTAWGFLKTGGYSGWDFWQYAPVGRIHIYPPFFHLILALLLKMGASPVILAKVFETFTPLLFMAVTWRFIKEGYSSRLGFFVLIIIASSFSFYMNLINHIPATLAMVFGLSAFRCLFSRSFIRSLLFLTLSFYTHIGAALFLAFSFIFYGLFDREYRKVSLAIGCGACLLAAPVIFKELSGIRFISGLGLELNEKYQCQFKPFEYILALFGLVIAIRSPRRNALFLSIFLASFIFLLYPYRFFSAEGYLGVIFLAAAALDRLSAFVSGKGKFFKIITASLLIVIFLSSITLALDRPRPSNDSAKVSLRLYLGHSALMGMLFPTDEKRGFSNSIWFADQFLSARDIIRDSSRDDEIIYSTLNIVGVSLAAISGRATANALFPEIGPARPFDPFQVSRITVFTREDSPGWIDSVAKNYNLQNIGENKIFILYRNPSPDSILNKGRPSVPFWFIVLAALFFTLIFWKARKIEKLIYRRR